MKGPAVVGCPVDDLLLGVEGVPLLTPSSGPSSSPPACARTETTGVEPKVIPPPRPPSSFGRPCNCLIYFSILWLSMCPLSYAYDFMASIHLIHLLTMCNCTIAHMIKFKFSDAPASLALMIVTHSLTDGLMETGDWKF